MAHEHAIELIDLELESIDSHNKKIGFSIEYHQDVLTWDLGEIRLEPFKLSQVATAKRQLPVLNAELSDNNRRRRELVDTKEVLEKLDRGEFSNTYHPRYAVQGYVSFDRDKVIR
jgi:hypothetical protein